MHTGSNKPNTPGDANGLLANTQQAVPAQAALLTPYYIMEIAGMPWFVCHGPSSKRWMGMSSQSEATVCTTIRQSHKHSSWPSGMPMGAGVVNHISQQYVHAPNPAVDSRPLLHLVKQHSSFC
jgi:hypothetical protein